MAMPALVAPSGESWPVRARSLAPCCRAIRRPRCRPWTRPGGRHPTRGPSRPLCRRR